MEKQLRPTDHVSCNYLSILWHILRRFNRLCNFQLNSTQLNSKYFYYTDPSRLALTNARKFVDTQSQNTSDSECFDAVNQQIWMHLWGPCVMGVYYIMLIIKILRKRMLINRIFDNRRCQIILWWQLKEPLCRAWFGCSPNGYTPSDDYVEFPRAILYPQILDFILHFLQNENQQPYL